MLEPGSIFIDKYKIERQLGEGGMGKVFLATHVHLAERVAIKVLHREMTTRGDLVDRFLREARASVRLKTEHVVRILDADRAPDGLPYIVMEYLDGRDLLAMFRQRGSLPVGEVVDYMLQTCEAMAEAHGQALVHRDIKPANLFVTQRSDGTTLVKVLDFGISKTLDRDLQLTSSQAMLGTPAYMSPEQLRASRDVDTRTDVWSLGVVMFELLAGRQPFDAPSFGELVIQVVTQPAPPIGGDVPRGLASAIARCLERNAAARFQSVSELASAIAPYASDRVAGVSGAQRIATILRNRVQSQPALPIAQLSQEAMVAGATTEMTSNGAVHAMSTVTEPSSRRGWVVAGVAATIIAAVAAVALTTGGGAERQRVESAAPAAPSITPIAADARAIAVAADAAIDAPLQAPASAGVVTPPVPTTTPTKRHPPVRRTTTPVPAEPADPLGTRL
ncbi:MAG TPA: serine/threonine-protein kinase [Kofleriaceae bacterium]